MSRPIYSIKFPLVIERTRAGRRIHKRLVADQTGLHGARACAAGMITVALSDRKSSLAPQASWMSEQYHLESQHFYRLGMRQSALWARLFAGQIDQDDPRLKAIETERHQIAIRIHERCQAA